MVHETMATWLAKVLGLQGSTQLVGNGSGNEGPNAAKEDSDSDCSSSEVMAQPLDA